MLIALASPLVHPAIRAAAAGVRLLQSSDDRVSFEVRIGEYRFVPSASLEGTERLVIPGHRSLSRPGEPSVPSRKLLVAIPPEVSYSVRWNVLKAEPVGRHVIEPVPEPVAFRDDSGERFVSERYAMEEDAYTGYLQKPTVTEEGAVHVRHQRALPIWIHPVSYDPRTGETAIATHIRVEILFSRPGGGREREPFDGGTVPVKESPVWERILERALLNPERAARWRVKRLSRSREAGQAVTPPAPAITGPVVKLKIWDRGMHRVSASAVIAAGFPAGEPVANLHLFRRQYDSQLLQETITDIPFAISEDPGGVDGIFDGLDYLIFYGLELRDDPLQGDPVEKFAEYNCYWLGTTGGPMMARQALRRGYVSADTATASFGIVDRYEEDNWFIEYTPPDGEGFYETPLRIDFYGFHDEAIASFSVPFTVRAMKPGTTLQIKAEFLGGPGDLANREVALTIENSLGSAPLDNALVPEFDRVRYTSQPVPGSLIAEGTNQLEIAKTPGRGTLDAYLIWFSVSYEALYRAAGNAFSFHTASLAGDTSITVTSLTRRDLLLFDVTDPNQPIEHIVDDSLFTTVGGGYAFSFRDAIASQKRYVLAPLDGISEIPPGDIAAGTPNTLIGHALENGVDVLVVSHQDFVGEMGRWVAYRRAQGYKVLMADVKDIYDEFNGGVPNPRAIKNFIRHFFEKGNASFVVLVGDASEDNKNIHTESPPNFVPTESFPEYVGGSFNENEVVTSDKWYVLMDNDYLPGQNDYYPDLIIGRIPAGATLELQKMLNKTFKYEQPEASDFWRRRMIMVPDDAWSDRGDGSSCFRGFPYGGEDGFELGEEESAKIIETSHAGGYDVVRFYLSEYTDAIVPTPPQCVSSLVPREHTRLVATPELLGELSQGATLVSFQAHMNRSLITHEGLFTSKTYYATTGQDHRKITNDNRPFIVFGMGCHFSDYALNKEKDPTNVFNNDKNGDCLAELLLYTSATGGAVGTYGSSGFEYLTPNRIFTNIIHEMFFTTPPQDTMAGSNRAQVRWIFGEIMTLSEIEYNSPGPIKRHHLLGDPLLRIDAGPPRFEVTVDGSPVQSGDPVFASAGKDTIRVEAIISDEVAIEKIDLEIDGEDRTGSMTLTPLIDLGLDASRSYKAEFDHKLLPKTYDIILRAHQAPDTSGSGYSMVGEFVLRVQADVTLRVNGRLVSSGDPVPPKGDYLIELGFPILIDPSKIQVEIDDIPVPGLEFSHPSPQDSTTWLVSFARDLADGQHTLRVIVDGNTMAEFAIHVSTTVGLRQVVNYPNPFAHDTYFVYTSEVEITKGTIDVFTTSGKKVARIAIPPSARQPGQNAVHWDGRDSAGDEIANGVYLYVVVVEQRGKKSTIRGKMARIE